MLDVELTIKDLPERIADKLRENAPGFFDDIDSKFTMRQIMELTQLQLLFSRSDYVKQQAIEAIKDRVEGKPTQKVQLEHLEQEPVEFLLPGGRKIML